MPAASITNYYIGTGVLTWTPAGSSTPIDLGNCPKFEFDPKVQKIQHYSSRLGRKMKDDSRIVVMEPEITITLDEWTQENLQLVLIGSLPGGQGNPLNIMDQFDVRGQLVFTGANGVGPKKTVTLPLVMLTPTGKLEFINANNYGELELVGEVLGNPTTGSFGTIVDTGVVT